MEIILNDLSLDGQFRNFEEFEVYFENILKNILKIIAEKKIPLYKMADLLQREVMPGITLHETLRCRTNIATATIFKQRISQIMGNPYLEENIQTLEEVEYEYPVEIEKPNCFTEAIERKSPMLSFPQEKYEADIFECKKSGNSIMLPNIKDVKQLLECYLPEALEDIEYILSNYPFSKKVVLAKINNRCYTAQALLENGLLVEDVQKIIHQIPELIDDKENGRKTHRWAHIDGQINEYRVTISADREFRIFFLWQEKLIFLNGFIKKRQSTPKEEKRKAKELADFLAC